MTPREYMTALMETPNKDLFVIFDPRDTACQFPIKNGVRALIAGPLENHLNTAVGFSGTLVMGGGARYYVFVPWRCVQWVGRDFGTEASIGQSFVPGLDAAGRVRRATAPRESGVFPISGPRTVGIA